MMPIDNFFRSAARWPNRIAVEINDGADQRKITYGDLSKSVNALANAQICSKHGFSYYIPSHNPGEIFIQYEKL